MEKRKKPLFREKSMDRMSASEQLTDYIRVPGPSLLMVILAIGLLVSGAVFWALSGLGFTIH